MLPQKAQHADWVVQRLIAQYASVVEPGHLWFDESERWRELAFAVAIRGSGTDEHHLRRVFRAMAPIGLLDCQRLAHAGESDRQEWLAFVSAMDVAPEDARRILALLTELASRVETRFGGRVQRWLRVEGERLADQMTKELDLASMPGDQLRQAVTFWLQNTCALPVPLNDSITREWCTAEGTTFDAVTEAADRADVNLAFVDDLILAAIQGEAPRKPSP